MIRKTALFIFLNKTCLKLYFKFEIYSRYKEKNRKEIFTLRKILDIILSLNLNFRKQ